MGARLDPRERAFAHELSYGATRLRGRLDHLIAPHARRGLDRVDPIVLEVLRLGAYQLLYMDGVPEYAAVSESVELVKRRVGAKPSGFVNAVLRRVKEAGDGPERFPRPEEGMATFLSSWGSHPMWLVERWLKRWSEQDVRGLVEAGNRRPDVCLYGIRIAPEELLQRLDEAGVSAEPVGGGSPCVRLDRGVHPARALEAVPEAIVQDPAANSVVLYSDVPPGTKVADLCAAPGGKALAASERAAFTLASDRSESRLHMLRDNARRVRSEVACVVADARRPPLREADVVLLDVPCTGTGTLSRHPDARWRLRPEAVDSMAALQSEMIRAAAEVVAPGGFLVYSTCSLESEENEGVVRGFLADRPDFDLCPGAGSPTDRLDDEGFHFVTPQDGGFDGAFAARLRKVA